MKIIILAIMLAVSGCQGSGMWDKPGIAGTCHHVKMPNGDTQVVCY